MLVDDELNADVVHGQGAAEGACFAHQYRALLAQRAVDGLDEAGLAAAFGAGPMRGGRQHVAVGLPLVGKIPSTRAVFVWQGRPQAAQGGRPPAAQHPGHDAPRVSLDGQPSQTLRCLRPTKVHLSSSSSTRGRLGLGRNCGLAATFFCQLDDGGTRDTRQAHNGALRNPLDEQLFNLGIGLRFAGGGRRKYRLVATHRTLVFRRPFQAAVFAHGRAAALATCERCLKHSPR